ncbi:MAG: zinc metallopeptidase [Treponema sp.]|nr:zinc metallopeptidase [Treponema sp.]
MFMPMFFDDLYILLVLPTLLLSLWAQFMVKSTFAKYSRISSSRKITGVDAAAILLKSNNIRDVKIEAVGGTLTDHYSPMDKKLRLSDPVYGSTSIAAIGVAAHEAGHAIQHATRWSPLVMRSTLVPVANIGSRLGPILAIAGIFLTGHPSYNTFSQMLFNIGILLFSGAVLFYLVTLPVEFNASNRALALLRSNNILSEQELRGAKKVLTAAALTYVASALTAIASLLRLILLSRRRR